MKQLRDVDAPLANFFAQGVLRLGHKLGPLLWQFSPRFRFDRDKLERFLALLPRDCDAAAGLLPVMIIVLKDAPGSKPKPVRRCATLSRSGTRVFSTPNLSRFCGGTTSRWFSPTLSAGPMPRT